MMSDFLAAVWWYFLVSLYGLSVFPISFLIFRHFPDRGLLLARPLGMLLVTYLCWVLGYAFGYPFSVWGELLVIGALAAISLWILLPRWKRIFRTVRSSAGFLLLAEGLTFLAFLLLVQARRHDPNLNHTEMAMDLAFFRSLWRGNGIPPVDPWFAGEPINYYYGGYMIFAAVSKLSGLTTGIAYNLSVAGVFMLAVSVSFVLGAALTGSTVWAGITALCAAIIGNLAGVVRIVENGKIYFSGYELKWGYLWNCSRVIYDGPPGADTATINEFPFFAEVWANLHGHMSNIPFTLLFVALLVALLRSGLDRLSVGTILRLRWPLLLILVISLGGLGFVNLFDLPVFFLVYGCAVLTLVGQARQRKKPTAHLAFLCSLFAFPLIAYLAYFPFHRDFIPPLQYPATFPFGNEKETLIRFADHHSGLWEFLCVFGFHISVLLAYLCWKVGETARSLGKEIVGMIGIAAATVFLIFAGLTGHLVWSATLCGSVLFILLFIKFALFPSMGNKATSSERFALGAIAVCLSIWWFCEVFFIKDNYGCQRMNTLFKFHFPTWLILGFALPVLAQRLWTEGQKALLVVPGMLMVLSLACPLIFFVNVLTRSADPTQPMALDGQNYLKRDFPAAYEMIRFVDDNIPGQPVILEAPGTAYQYDAPAPENVLSANTGAPTVLGWENHEGLWRGHPQEISLRKQDITVIYSTPDIQTATKLLKKYGVSYVYVGGQERRQYPARGFEKFEGHFPVAFRGMDVLYWVP